jgi:hypothetical protein
MPRLSGLPSFWRVTQDMTCEFIPQCVCYRTNVSYELRLLNHLLEQGLFEPKKGESQMWGQRSSCYAATVRSHLLAKIHHPESSLGDVDCSQSHPIDCLEEHMDFVGGTSNCIGRVVDELNNCIDAQDVQIDQLANMVNDLVGKTEGQSKEIKSLKAGREEHCKVINTLTAKVIALEQCVEDVQRKAFSQAGKWPNCCLDVVDLISKTVISVKYESGKSRKK